MEEFAVDDLQIVNLKRVYACGIKPGDLSIPALVIFFYFGKVAAVSHRLEDREYFWVAHGKVIKDNPYHEFTKTIIQNNVTKLIKFGLLERHSNVRELNRSYYRLTNLGKTVILGDSADDNTFFKSKKKYGAVKKVAKKPKITETSKTYHKNMTGNEKPIIKKRHEYNNINNKEYINKIIEEEKEKAFFRKNLITHFPKDQRENIDVNDLETAKDDPYLQDLLTDELTFQIKYDIKADEKTLQYRMYNEDAVHEFCGLLVLFNPDYMRNYDIWDAYQLYIRRRIFDDLDTIRAVIYSTMQSHLIEEKPYLFTPIFCLRRSVFLANKASAGEEKITHYRNVDINDFMKSYPTENTYPNGYELP